MATDRPMVHTYLSKEEKKAIETIATLNDRSVSSMIRVMIVQRAKELGIMKETINADGAIVQTITFEGNEEERSEDNA